MYHCFPNLDVCAAIASALVGFTTSAFSPNVISDTSSDCTSSRWALIDLPVREAQSNVVKYTCNRPMEDAIKTRTR